jgi:phage repressor protein C with HTH and peptisase S24 domain
VEPGEKLKAAREYNSPYLTQAKLAKLLKVDTSTVGRWEASNHIPEDQLPRLADKLGIDEAWFVDGSDELPPRRKVLKEESPNIKPVNPNAMSRMEASIREGLLVGIPVWKGVRAGSSEECVFIEPDEIDVREIPLYLTLGEPERHVLCIASGMSMAPRIEHAERILVRLDPDVPVGHLVVARNPEGENFVKMLTKNGSALCLESLNPDFEPIRELDGWDMRGGVTAILHTYEPGRGNIEWDDGRFLR